jgi:hypothetical protein
VDELPPLTSVRLREIAAEAGYSVSDRRLEDWRHRDLLPKPTRQGNVGPTPLWVYPAGADEQLLDACRYRAHTRDLEAIKVALWFDGHPINTDAVLASLQSVLRRVQGEFEEALTEEATRLGGDEEAPDLTAALDSLSYRAAGMKGGRPVAKTIRMTRVDRARGIAYLGRLFLGLDIDDHADDARLAEQAAGIAAGRTGPDEYRWLTGPPAEEFADLRPMIALPELLVAVQAATAAELRTARRQARLFLQGLPVVARFAEALFGPRAAGFAAARNPQLVTDPAFYCLLLAGLIAANQSGFAANLKELEQPLAGLAAQTSQLDQLAALPPKLRERQLAMLSASDRIRMHRLLDLTTSDAEHQQ